MLTPKAGNTDDAEDAAGTFQPSSYHTGESMSPESEAEIAQTSTDLEQSVEENDKPIVELTVDVNDNPFMED